MQTDRELLELAAKAAGIVLFEDAELKDSFCIVETGLPWNPLEDDGDALRLAVQLDMIDERQWRAPITGALYNECNGDWFAATRRAIVRAAASIAQGGEGL